MDSSMVETANREPKRLVDMPHFPATVHDHTDQGNGVTLHTIGDDWKTDVEVYDSPNQPAHRAGEEPPEPEK